MQERRQGIEDYFIASPTVVVQETGELLSAYFKEALRDDASLALDYFKTSTARFIGDAIQGFLLYSAYLGKLLGDKELARLTQKSGLTPQEEKEPSLIDYLRRNLSRQELAKLLKPTGLPHSVPTKIELVKPDFPELPQIRTLPAKYSEAYALTVIIFGELRHKAPATQYVFASQPVRFPNTGPLSFPKDGMEMLDRLEELSSFVDRTVNLEITPRSLDSKNDSQRRSLAFFQVGKDLPVRETLTFDEEVRKLLMDTPLN